MSRSPDGIAGQIRQIAETARLPQLNDGLKIFGGKAGGGAEDSAEAEADAEAAGADDLGPVGQAYTAAKEAVAAYVTVPCSIASKISSGRIDAGE